MLWIWGRGKLFGKSVVAVIGLGLLAGALFAGCGGGGGSSSPDSSVPSSAPSAPAEELSKEFNDPEGVRGIEPVATFGKESDESERTEASAVLDESFEARQAANFAAQCATLGKRGMEAVFGLGKGNEDPSKCAAALEKIAKPLSQSKGVRKNTLSGEIAALRVRGDQAFALYHGNDGSDYAVPLEKEDGEWKVGSLITIGLPPTPVKPVKTADEGKEAKKGN